MASTKAAPFAATTDVHEAPIPFPAAPHPPATPAASDEAVVDEAPDHTKTALEDVITAKYGLIPEKPEAAPSDSEKVNGNATTEAENGEGPIEKEDGDGVEAEVIDPLNEEFVKVNEEFVKESPDSSIQPEAGKDSLNVSAEAEKKLEEETGVQPETEIEDAAECKTAPGQPENDVTTGTASQLESEPVLAQTTAPSEEEKKPRGSPKSNSHPSYSQMITEAIISLQDRTGSSQQAIAKSIEAKHKSALGPNFKKSLSIQLKRLCEQKQLVKVKNSYKLSGKAKNKLKAGGKSDAKSKPSKPGRTASKQKTKPTKKAATSKAKKGTAVTNISKTGKATKSTGNATKASRAKNTRIVAEPTTPKKPAKSNTRKLSSATTKPPEKATTLPAQRKSSRTSKAVSVKPSTSGAKSTKRKSPASGKKPQETAAPAKRTRRSGK